MNQIPRSDYNQSYFDGRIAVYSHNGGYDNYHYFPVFGNDAQKILENKTITGKSFIDVCCAKGYFMRALIENGVEQIHGVDFSDYAIENADPVVEGMITNEDALIFLQSLSNNQYDYLVIRHAVECFTDLQIEELVSEFNRVAENVIVMFSGTTNSNFYNLKSNQDWSTSFNWKSGTELYFQTEKIVI